MVPGGFIVEINLPAGPLAGITFGKHRNCYAGLFTAVKHNDIFYHLQVIHPTQMNEELFDPEINKLCETFEVRATPPDPVDSTNQKSPFVVWNENTDITGSWWHNGFESGPESGA